MTSGPKVADASVPPRPSVKKAVAFTGASQLWRMGIGFVSSIIIARLLMPEDFGLVAAVSPVVGFAVQMQNLGLTQAIIQRKNIEQHQLDALFWISMSVSFVLAAAIAIASPFLAQFFHDPRLQPLYLCGALSVLLTSAAAQPTALLSRDLRFDSIAIRDMTATVLAAAASIILAWFTRSYWALIANMVLSSALLLVLSARAARWLPGRPRYDQEVRHMLNFGMGVSSNNLLNFFSRNADNIIIARSTSPHALGIYDQAYRLLMYPLTQAVYPIGRVLLPTLSRRLEDAPLYRDTYRRTVVALLVLIHPGLLLTIVYSESFITILLGAKWAAAAPILSILGLAGLHQMYTSTNGWLYVSQGRGKDYAVIGLVTSIVTVMSFVVGIRWGIVGVAASYATSELLFRLPFTIWHVGRSGPVMHRFILRLIAPHVVALAVAGGALFAIHDHWPQAGIMLMIGLGVLSYLLYSATLALFPGPRVILHNQAAALIRKVQKT